jgi:hypothetical protein
MPAVPIALVALAAIGLAASANRQLYAIGAWLRGAHAKRAGRVVLAVALAVALPGFIRVLAYIVDRSPGS